jgi:CheY-like chemotaxis protein
MKKRILIVEDDKLNAKFFDFTLRRRGGHQVEVEEDVERILQRARSGEIDLVIMDVSLSNSRYEGQPLDGPGVCRLLKGDPRSSQVPILLATAYAMKGDRENLLKESGADDYIAKPIDDPADLIDKVDALLERKPEPAGRG